MVNIKIENWFIVVAVIAMFVAGYVNIESECVGERNLLDMSEDLNRCVETTRGPCCKEHSDLILEAKRIGLNIKVVNSACK